MKYMHSEWSGRLRHWINTLRQDIYLPVQDIAFEGFFTMEHLTPEQAAQGSFSPIPRGTKWGKMYEYCWLRATVTVPEGNAPRYALNLPVGSEATLFLDGKAFGTYRSDWVKDPLHYIVDNFLPVGEPAGTKHELLIEAYAGHFFPQSTLGGCATGPVMPGAYQDPKKDGERAEIGHCTLGIWSEDAYQLLMDVMTLQMLMEQLDDNSLRADKIAAALEHFTLAVDFEQPLEQRIQSYREGRKALAPALAARNGSTMPVFYGIGNAHLDLVWLWPIAETIRKTARTFAAQLRLLDEYPDYMFLQSQPASYVMCRDHYPELYERVRKAIRDGRWIAEGAMWSEPDTNMTSGESLIRQIVHGKRFYKEELGVDSQLLWLPDSFGYSAALPQILNGCGVKYLVTQKIFWSYNEGDQFPYHYFTWQGADGSAIDTFLPTSYTYRTDPKEICETWNKRVEKRGLDAFLLPFGYGDGGGGPCRDYLEYMEREKDLEGMPKMRMASPITFFKDMEAQGGPNHTYVGELYFSAHRGVYTAQAAVKKGNRKGEIALREAEVWGSLAQAKGHAYPYADMDAQWKVLLFNQFHDILPGSSIARVYDEALEQHNDIIRAATGHAADAQQALITKDEGVTVFNSLCFERQALVTLPADYAQGAVTQEGAPVPTQPTQNGALALVDLPAVGAVSLTPATAKGKAGPCTAAMEGANVRLTNDHVDITFNALGEITSFVDKATGREYAAGPMNKLLMYKDVPRLFDAWDIDSHYELQPVVLDEPATITVLEASGLRASLRVTRRINNSQFTQDICLYAHSGRLDFITTVEWNELHRLLKVGFPVNVRATEAINEIQFGYMKRPTHRSRLYDSDRFEVCNQRYSALCDQNHGAAVLNDCKYGISLHDNEMRLTLLRASTSPEMRADNGTHTFTYSFLAWEGSFMDAPVVHQAYDLNVPATVMPGSAPTFSAFSVDAPNVFIDTIKPAEDQSGDLILRLYEAKRADTACTLSINLPVKQVLACDMLENPLASLDGTDKVDLAFHTFEVKTLRLKLA